MDAGGLVHRPIRNQQVVGSNPTGGSAKSQRNKVFIERMNRGDDRQ
jgi:hypothetical protein